jgi:hypothetical protein
MVFTWSEPILQSERALTRLLFFGDLVDFLKWEIGREAWTTS